MSSLTNFAVAIYIVRSLGATQFGAFSVAYVTYAFALNASRGLSTDPLIVRFSGVETAVWRRAVASCTATSLLVGSAAGVCVLAAAVFLNGPVRLAFLALGLTLPGLMLQDSWRYAFFAHGRGSHAFLNDTIWAALLAPGLFLLRKSGHDSVFWFVLAWGGAAAVAASVGPLQAWVLPRLAGAWSWLTQHRDLGFRYLVEGTSSSASTQLRTYGVAVLLSLTAVGYIQAATTLTGPVQVLFLGMSLVTIPEGARVLRRSPRHLPLFCILVSVGLAVAALAWGIALWVAVPRGFGQWLVGPIWRPTYRLMIPQTLYLVGQGFSGGAGSGLHALGAARRSLRALGLTALLTLVCGLLGAATDGAAGAIGGTAAAAWLSAPLMWWEMRKALREHASATDQTPGPRGHAARHRRPESDVPHDSAVVGQPAQLVTRSGRAGGRSQLTWVVIMMLPFLGFAITILYLIVGSTHQPASSAATVNAHSHAGSAATSPSPAPTQPSTPAPVRRTPVSAVAIGPGGIATGDNSQSASLAIDGSMATSWTTKWYATANFGNLQAGTGLLLDMGQQVTVTSVQISLANKGGASVQLRSGDVSKLAALRTVAQASDVGGLVTLHIHAPTAARYLLLWFTKLPRTTAGHYQESVYNVSLAG